MRITLIPPLGSRLSALLDCGAIVAFVLVGLVSHDGAVSGRGLARDAIPLLVGWTAAALLLHPYRKRTRRALIATWAIGIPLGVVIRGLALGRNPDGEQLAFLLTTLIFSACLIAVVRIASGAIPNDSQ